METIDDIVRKVAEEMLNTSMQDITAEIICGWANRLGDVATCDKSSQVGNAAALREVVAETEKRIDKVISILTEIPDSCGYGGLLEDAADELCDLKEEFVKPVLSAPARNCDLYETESERRTAFIDWYNETFELKGSKDAIDTCDLKHDVDGILHEYIKWLFAEAKEKQNEYITLYKVC